MLGTAWPLLAGCESLQLHAPLPRPQSGEFQRWRLAWATSKRWASLALVDKRGEPAPCEMLLVGKDAVYLMEVRFTVQHMGSSVLGRAAAQRDLRQPTPHGMSALQRAAACFVAAAAG